MFLGWWWVVRRSFSTSVSPESSFLLCVKLKPRSIMMTFSTSCPGVVDIRAWNKLNTEKKRGLRGHRGEKGYQSVSLQKYCRKYESLKLSQILIGSMSTHSKKFLN